MTTETLTLKTAKMIAYKEDGVGWMVFNNPERLNAVALEMSEAIPVILGDFNADSEVRVVVMTGAGNRAFVSGADISEFEARRSNPQAIAEYSAIGARAAAAYRELDKPLIAMVRGYCIGGGLVTAMKADLRICSEGSQFGIPAVRVGLGYAYESVKAMVDLIGPAHARMILLTGNRFDAETALRMGLVNQVVPADELETTVKDLATTMAQNAPLTTRTMRIALDMAVRDREDRDIELVNRLVAECFASEDYVEGRRSFMEKRRPVFHGR